MKGDTIWTKFSICFYVLIIFVGTFGVAFLAYKLVYYVFDYRTLIPFEVLIFLGMLMVIILGFVCVNHAENNERKNAVAECKKIHNCNAKEKYLNALLKKVERDYCLEDDITK